MKRLRLVVISLLATVAVGCGSSNSTADAAGADGPEQEAAAPPPPYCTTKPPIATVTDLSGTWVVRMVGAQIVAPSFLSPFPVQSVFYLLYDVRQDGIAITIDGHYCDRTEIDPPNALVPVIIPPAWAHTEKPVGRKGSFVTGTHGVPVLSLSPAVEIAGAVLASPSDLLPTVLGDDRIIDEDGDGNPGITVVLNGQGISGQVFSVQRQTTSVSAIVVAPDRIEGALTFASEQNVLASIPTNIASEYAMATTTTDPAICNSAFAMVKVADAQPLDGGVDGGEVDGGGASAVTCDWVRAREAILFPQ